MEKTTVKIEVPTDFYEMLEYIASIDTIDCTVDRLISSIFSKGTKLFIAEVILPSLEKTFTTIEEKANVTLQ